LPIISLSAFGGNADEGSCAGFVFYWIGNANDRASILWAREAEGLDARAII
jgi:hypothetical protein